MSKYIVCQLKWVDLLYIVMQMMIHRNKETMIYEDEFHGVLLYLEVFLFCHRYTNLAKYWIHTWNFSWANISWNHHLGSEELPMWVLAELFSAFFLGPPFYKVGQSTIGSTVLGYSLIKLNTSLHLVKKNSQHVRTGYVYLSQQNEREVQLSLESSQPTTPVDLRE